MAGFVLGIGYIMTGFMQEKKGLHDILADTRVIYGKCETRRNSQEGNRKQKPFSQPQQEQKKPQSSQWQKKQDAVQKSNRTTATLYDQYQHINVAPSDKKSSEDKE